MREVDEARETERERGKIERRGGETKGGAAREEEVVAADETLPGRPPHPFLPDCSNTPPVHLSLFLSFLSVSLVLRPPPITPSLPVQTLRTSRGPRRAANRATSRSLGPTARTRTAIPRKYSSVWVVPRLQTDRQTSSPKPSTRRRERVERG